MTVSSILTILSLSHEAWDKPGTGGQDFDGNPVTICMCNIYTDNWRSLVPREVRMLWGKKSWDIRRKPDASLLSDLCGSQR